jgi:hypothetical protein
MLDNAVFRLILPDGMLNYFSIIDVKELCRLSDKKTFYELHIEENNELHSGYDASQYESKGFTEITIQDFPLRGKDVFLVIKRLSTFKNLTEKDYRNYILKEYTFLKRPVVIIDEKIFIGSEKKTVAALMAAVKG